MSQLNKEEMALLNHILAEQLTHIEVENGAVGIPRVFVERVLKKWEQQGFVETFEAYSTALGRKAMVFAEADLEALKYYARQCGLQPRSVAIPNAIRGVDMDEHYDIFLCHNSQDKSEVSVIGNELKRRGLVPWLDDWNLRPGIPWQSEIERCIQKVNSAAVFVGSSGIGPWQRQEIDAFLREFVKRACPVIPVLLSSCSVEPQLPVFLRGMTWVDFRSKHELTIDRLVWGVTGEKPKALVAASIEPIGAATFQFLSQFRTGFVLVLEEGDVAENRRIRKAIEESRSVGFLIPARTSSGDGYKMTEKCFEYLEKNGVEFT